ncbi:uncharacterized protein LOC122507836 [Leptopilina heterotoma]|uniref:uncharacterized protein LOC122507836 n=1 Tax=Leptopilina heterotoma TaxID=63436 RepID=UPI001CA8081D|nr:uncharacterized protein LOC122507836 [Leptopilina heterotoma]
MGQQLKYKGRFIKEKVLKHKMKRRELVKKNAERRVTSKEQNYPCEGTRLVDLRLLGNNLICRVCKNTLSLQNIKEEKRSGLHSVLSIQCKLCSLVTKVETGEKHNVSDESTTFVKAKVHNDVNTNAVLGAFHAGIGRTQLNKILACLNVPNITTKVYRQYEQEVGPAIEETARDSCKKSAREERKLVLERLEDLREAL